MRIDALYFELLHIGLRIELCVLHGLPPIRRIALPEEFCDCVLGFVMKVLGPALDSTCQLSKRCTKTRELGLRWLLPILCHRCGSRLVVLLFLHWQSIEPLLERRDVLGQRVALLLPDLDILAPRLC